MDVIISAIKMLGGLALLIYGMKMLSSQLKKLSGGKLESILSNVTNNPFKGLLVGFIITVATQSSAATTVIVVSLVNSGILGLRNSIPIIMGANIGTTVNSQILRLAGIEGSSWLSFLSPAVLAPIILIISLIIMSKARKQKTKDVGQLLLGLGLLFTGMITMVNMASSFSDLPILGTILQKLSNPVLGVLAGALVTALVQSSAATVGILQAMSTTGIITWATTIPIILGQNIGTCFTSILASLGGNKNAKRVACVHLYFNLIGTIVFLIGIYTYQSLVGFSFWNSSVDMGGIANFHTFFNIASTIMLFPFIKQLEKLTMITVRDDKKDNEEENEDDYLLTLQKLDDRATTIPRLAIANSVQVINKMGELANKNFTKSMLLLFNEYSESKLEKIQHREDSIDKMEEKVTRYLVKLGKLNLSDYENNSVSALMRIESEIEKVGDYAYRLAKTIEHMNDNEITISEEANKELLNLYNLTEEAVLTTLDIVRNRKLNLVLNIEALKEISEIKREEYKNDHILRLKDGICNVESGIAFLEILTVFEKIMHHCVNATIATSNMIRDEKFVTKQDFTRRVYETQSNDLKLKLNEYSIKYA